ncbi:MAG: hypothetical protein V2I51_11910 [Anderseniella sp.]|nr:hypothetical protein [Anderseniella sp.]
MRRVDKGWLLSSNLHEDIGLHMGKALTIIISLIAGGAIGGFVGGSLGFGAGAGNGIAVGLPAGVCGVTRAAQDEGLLSKAQVDQVLNRAVSNLKAIAPDAEATETITGASEECDKILAKLKEAAKK